MTVNGFWNCSENQFNGKEEVLGDLDLGSLTSIPEGFNPTVGGSLFLGGLTHIPYGFNPTVGGDLYLQNLTSIPEGFNPIVGGDLDLGSLTSIPEGFNPTVGRDLYLGGLTHIPDGFNPTVGRGFYLGRLNSIPEGFNPIVGGDLDLRSLTSIPEGFNPTVGGSLDLRGLTHIPDGFNPTVGGNLYIQNLTDIPEGFNPTVGGYLGLRIGLTSKIHKPKGTLVTTKNKLLFWQDGKFVKADGIFTEVVSKKGNAYLVRKVNTKNTFYLYSDGITHAHGHTLKWAKKDFEFKLFHEKIKKDPIKKDTVITANYYRFLTGACEIGIKQWMQENNIENETILAKDLLHLLEKTKAYGLEKFKSFYQDDRTTDTN